MSKSKLSSRHASAASPTDKNVDRKIKAMKKLSSEDRSRLQRLSEEVDGRLSEMRLIIERTLQVKLEGDAVKIRTSDIKALAKVIREKRGAANQSTYDHCFCGGGGCGCYIDPPGICIEV